MSNNKRANREARLRWVPIARMRVSPLAQRELNQSRVDRLVADFNLEQIGAPVVSYRDDWYWIIDGQHRIAALKAIGYGDQQIQCWCYEGHTEEDDAEQFLQLNDVLAVNALSKFRVAVHAGREEECDINRIVLAAGCRVTRDSGPGAINAVSALRKVYKRGGPGVLARTLRIVRDAYGDTGFDAGVIDGIGHLCQRYNGTLNDDLAIQRLSAAHGGIHGLRNRAEQMRRQTGNQRAHCVAAAAVEFINRGRGGKKLPDWWKA